MRRMWFGIGVVMSCLLWSAEVPQVYLQAMDAIAAQRYDEATQLLLKALQDVSLPREYQARVYSYLGDIAVVNQSYRQAQAYYRKVLESYSDTSVYSRALYSTARMFVIVGDYDAGIALLSDYLNRHAVNDANEDGALYWLGRSFAAKKEYYRALGIYRELLNRFPSSVYAYQTRQFVQDIEKSLQASTSEKDIQKIAVRQNRYLTLVAELLELQNKLLDLKKQKIDELTLMMSREGL